LPGSGFPSEDYAMRLRSRYRGGVLAVWVFICLAPFLRSGPLTAAEPPRPNLILIMSDDIGIGGFSCYGGYKPKTPPLDALARDGLRFEHCFSMALCGPSRACLLTGRYAFRTGMVDNNTGKRVTPDREVCVAKVLKEAGYATAFAGKWN